MRLTAVTHARLTAVVERWRAAQRMHAGLVELDPTGQRRVLANAYQECANDLDLALRDDASLQPKSSRG